MLFQTLWLASVCASAVSAFKDTSPFFAFSTSNQLNLQGFDSQEYQALLASQVSSSLLKSLSGCPTDVYVIVSQPEVSARDYEDRNAAPHLRRRVNLIEDGIMSTVTIPDVVGSVELGTIRAYLERQCKATTHSIDAATGVIKSNHSYPQVILVNFPTLPPQVDDRASELAKHDSFLNALLSPLSSFTVLYTSTPLPEITEQAQDVPPRQPYTWDYDAEEPFPSVVHTDLKRDLRSHTREKDNGTLSSSVPLFEKYNFLSPVGVNAVASLQVSYFSFSKEMNPANQKKQ